MNLYLKLIFFLLIFSNHSYCFAQNNSSLELGSEYEDYNKERYRGKVPQLSKKSDDGSVLTSVLLYLPNRVLDLLDIFRFDLGVGPSAGGVIRITPYGQAGVRFLMPVSLRAGLRGRRSPFFIEHTSEMGIGPAFLSSESRKPSVLEVGAGLDLFIAGVYMGISLDSIGDALVGFAGFDPSEDDF